jgi:predicted RNase H-like HicB family nuclease
MTRYIGLLDGQAGAYGVTFPDLPGCTSGGATADEAATNSVEAVSLWVEDALAAGDDIPRPRTLDEIRADSDVVAEAAEIGAVFISVPAVARDGRPARFNWSVDAGLLSAVRQAARARGMTEAAWLASAAREKIAAG